MKQNAIQPANLEFNAEGTPVSRDFDDVYFSNDNGLEETRYVFLDGNQLSTRFPAHPRSLFVVAESGFGTGLNFLTLWQAFNQFHAAHPEATLQRLHFISFEKFPLTAHDLRLAHQRWPELAPLSAAQEHALGDGPAVYYTVPGWQGSIGFIAAVHGKFCASCNRVRLTSQGFLRPCLASETGCDLRALLRGDADDAQLLTAIRETIWAKPREHHFNDSSMPATRGMYRIGG